MPRVPLNRDRAWACVLLNLGVPGWGSLKAGRPLAGMGEMVILIAGLVLFGTWMYEWLHGVFVTELGDPPPPAAAPWLWEWGIGLVGTSCVWTIITCVSIMREAKAHEKDLPPPRLSDLPKPPIL